MRFLADVVGPFQGHHNPLRGGWDDEQLARMSQALAAPSATTALMACSLIAEECTTGLSLRCSRKASTYSYFIAYQGDPLLTYRKVIVAYDWLIKHAYAEGQTGLWWLKKQSVIRATSKLMALAHLVDVSARLGATLKDEIILRDEDGTEVGFADTDETRQMRRRMKTINGHLASQRYFLDGVEVYVPPMTRIFNENFRRGGRMYCQGSSYQQMPRESRAKIEMLMSEGELSPTVELDFSSLHLRLLYLLAGKRQPDGDLYTIQGYSRPLVKRAVLIAINADGTEVGALTHILEADDDLCRDNGVDRRDRWALQALVIRLLDAIKRKHYRIKAFFGSGAGAGLMRTDSDIAVRVMLEMIEKTGRCPLVVHDSFIVPTQDAELLELIMAQALEQAPLGGVAVGVFPRKARSLPTPHQAITPHPHIHLGKQPSDQLVPATSDTQNNSFPTPHPDLPVGKGPPGSKGIPVDAEIGALLVRFDSRRAPRTTSPSLEDVIHHRADEGRTDR